MTRTSATAAAAIPTLHPMRLRSNRLYSLDWLPMFRLFVFVAGVAAQQLREVLGERRARQHHVASGFGGLHFQLALHVRDEANNVGFLFQLALEFGNNGERLGGHVVQ